MGECCYHLPLPIVCSHRALNIKLFNLEKFPPTSSDRFKADIAEDEVKLTELNERRNEKLARVKIVQKEKDSLEGGKREAEEYLRMENEVGADRQEPAIHNNLKKLT